MARAGLAALDGDAAAKNVELGLGGLAGDFDQVSFFHAGGGFGEPVGQFAVVGDDEQPLAHVVEAANGVEALLHLLEELHHRGPALGVFDRGDKAAGLVEDEVAMALGALQQLAVDADVVAAGVGFGAQHGDDFAVDLDAALLDHRLGAAAAGNAGGGENLLQPLELGGGRGLGVNSGSEPSSDSVSVFGFGSELLRLRSQSSGFAVGFVSDWRLQPRHGFDFRCGFNFG